MLLFLTATVIEDPVGFYAERLSRAFSGIGTNDNMLIRIVVSRSEVTNYVYLSHIISVLNTCSGLQVIIIILYCFGFQFFINLL